MDLTRFAPPRASTRHVPRGRLLGLIGSTPSGGLCVITGGPGFGKTQLLTDWVTSAGVRAAWLTVDASDNDPARFWHHLGASCRRAGFVPQVTVEHGRDRIGDLDAFLAALAESRFADPAWLVVDDAHLLVNESLRTDLARLVRCLPGDLRMAVASRVELRWPLAHGRARGLVVDVRERALALDRQEVSALLTAAGLVVEDATVERLLGRTEGWAAGVQLAIRGALESEDAGHHLAHVRGDDQSIADFLLEEALDHQPEDRRRFLLETSILDRLTGPLCDAVTGRPDSSRMLSELARQHVLVNRLAGDDVAWYRYHALFAELLRAELTADEPDVAAELHRRAATWFAAHGEIEGAVRHFLAGGEVAEAADLVHAHEDVYFRLGQVALLREWYAALPPTADTDPDDQMLRLVWASLGLDDPPAVWEPALNQLRRRAALDDAPASLAPQLAVVDAHLAARIGDAQTMRRRCQDAIDAFHAVGVGLERPAVAYASLLAARAGVWCGALDEAEWAIEKLLADPSLTDPFWINAFDGALAYIDAEQGRHELALSRADAALAAQDGEGGHPTSGLEAGLARVVALRSLERATDAYVALDLARAGAQAGTTGAPFLILLAVEEARLALDSGDLDGARRALSSVDDLPRFQRGSRDLATTLDHWRDAMQRRAGTTSLTERELEVLARLPTRLTLQEIADELFVSTNTVKTHVKSIYAKLHVTNRDDAARRAADLRLIGP